MSDLVGNPEDWFSSIAAHIIDGNIFSKNFKHTAHNLVYREIP